MASTSLRKPVDAGENGASGLASGSTKDLLTSALQVRIASNNYIAHLKIWETVNDGPGGAPQRKARYLILAVQRDSGRVTINKAKRNANGTFSIGKDWDLNQLREIVVDQPDTFTLTLSRSYSWQTERAREQTQFLLTIVKVFRKYTGEDGPHCVGLDLQAPANGSASQPTPSRQSSKDDGRTLPQIDTAVPKQWTRESPQKQTSAGPRSAAHDGFYDPVGRQGAPQSSPERVERTQASVPSISTSVAQDSNSEVPQRRQTMERQASAMAVMTPTVESVESAMGNLSVGNSVQRSTSQGNSPHAASTGLPLLDTPPGATSNDSAATAKVARSPSRIGAKLAAVMDRAATPTRREPSRSATPTQAVAQEQAPKPAPAIVPPPRRPPQARKRNSERYSSSTLTPNTGGDARARLSSIEPARGGAAYEKMLLAGTGLSGVAEGDDDEDDEDVDPYGGADISEINEATDILPRAASVRRKRKSQRIDNKDVQDAKMAKGDAVHDDDEDNTLQYVEEMLEGFDFRRNTNSLNARFATDRAASRTGAMVGKGTADIIEARLLDELEALDAANIHAIIESDDRVNLVVQHMEQALHELDVIDSMIAGFKVQLNARAEDIYHIESQNRGLQVQTSNQRALATEIEKLLNTVHVDESAIGSLLNTDFASDADIGELEAAGSALYKAMLQARRTKEDAQHGDAGMAAALERLDEYNGLADRFAKRLLKYLSELFNEQTYTITHDNRRVKALNPPTPTMTDHSAVESVLGRYCGLLLYAKEVSPSYFTRISAAYFASASDRYKSEMTKLFSVCKGQVAKVSEDEVTEANLIPPSTASAASALRSGTIRRGGRDRGGKGSKLAPGEMTGSEAFTRILTSITPIVIREQNFISDLLHINNNAITFADYMDLEAYFRRRAALVYGGGSNGVSGMVKSMRDALDLIFGFLAPEWQGLIDHVTGKDKIQVVGILAALDRGMLEADETNNEFLLRSLSKIQMRLASQLESYITEQIRGIDQTKLTARKRKGVVHFIKAFPIFVDRIEAQLVNAESLQIRAVVDHYYEQVCSRMFDVLQTMAIPKMEGGTFSTSNTDEDKGQLNHHVILIENMFHITKGITRVQTTRNTTALQAQLKRAQNILDDALHAYVQSVLRRSLGKMIDFGDGIDSLLRNTPPNEVSLHSTYSRQAAKRLVKEYNSKDLRKAVEALARRVQKHFDEDEITTLVSHDAGGGVSNVYDASGISADEIVEVLSTVWRHLEDGFTSECERLIRILRECYTTNDSKLLAEYTIEDARRPFASNSPAGRRR